MDITPKVAIEMIEGIIRQNLELAAIQAPTERYTVPMLEGKPGCGKTTCVRTAARRVAEDLIFLKPIADALGMDVLFLSRTIILAQFDSVDIGGLVWPKDGRMIRLRPAMLPETGLGILLFDECRKANTAVHNVLGQILLEYRVGEHRISPAYTMILASNERKHKAGDIELPTHIIDRVSLVRLITSLEQFLEYGLRQGIDGSVLWFLKSNPEHFDKHVPESLPQPSARSWEKVSDLVKAKHLGGQALRALIEGTVGGPAGHAFYTYLSMKDKLPDPDYALRHADTVEIPSDPQARYAMMGSVAGVVNKDTIGGLEVLTKRFDDHVRNGRELSVFAVNQVSFRDPSILRTKAGLNLTSRYHELLLGTA